MTIEEDMEKVIPAIFSGMKNVMEKQINSRGFDDVSVIKPEYVFTVGIFDSIVSAINGEYPPDAKYVIRLEESIRDIKFKCFPAYATQGNEGILSKWIGQQYHLIRNKRGKVDIAVYFKSTGGTHQEETTCLIEVKGFNPSLAELKKDLKRLSELKSMEQPTGPSYLKKTYLAYLITETPFSDINEFEISSSECNKLLRCMPELQITPERFHSKIIDENLPNPDGYPEDDEVDASEFYRWVALVVEV